MKDSPIQISQPQTGIEEWESLKDSILSGWLTTGPKTSQFETSFAEYHDVDYAISTTSATAALHLSLIALNIGPNDEVILPSFTWVATANVVRYCGAKPVFVDISLDTYNIDPVQIRQKITPNTKAIIPVHLFGLCADIDKIREVAPNIPLIEDAACAVGAKYKGRYAGSLGALGCFSFHPRKIITTGEGGMITTNDKDLSEKCEQLKNHGASISEEQRHKGNKPHMLPDFRILGYNYRMTDLQGSVGNVQIKKLSNLLETRRKWAEFYSNELADIEWIDLPKVEDDFDHAWQAYVVYVNPALSPISRNVLMDKLYTLGINTRPGTHAVHMLDYYKLEYDIDENSLPNSKDANNNSMAIPLHNMMTQEMFNYVVSSIKSFN